MSLPRPLFKAALLSCLASTPVLAAPSSDFAQLSLDELLQIRVTSVSRKEQSLASAPASIFVVTGDDIEQLGATTLAESLRLSPGMQIARIDAHEMAVSSRGFNDLYSNKLLVLMDGRTIYNQLFSGVFWNQNAAFLADLDHIEIIRGPGSTQWGANAVNGVVSVSSKNARDTLGGLLSYASGSQTSHFAEVRQGMMVGANTAMRVYAKYQQEDDYGIWVDASTTGWEAKLAGMRWDWQEEGGASLTWITEARETLVGNNSSMPSYTPPYANVRHEDYRIGAWMSLVKGVIPVAGDGRLSVQGYLDFSDRSALKFGEDRSIADIDAQLELPLPHNHDLMMGVSFRQDHDNLTPSIAYGYSVPSDTSRILGLFVQDEVTMLEGRVQLNAGIKFEKGSLFGWEPQPSLRAVYRVNATNSLWASLTRAARTPSRSERNLRMMHSVEPPSAQSGGLPTAVFLTGTEGFQTEHLTAWELGFRSQPHATLSMDAAVFFNDYTDLRDINATPSLDMNDGPPHIALDSLFINAMEGHTYGLEISARWRPLSTLSIDTTFSTIRYKLTDKTPILPYPAAATEGTTPRYQATARLCWTPIKTLSFNLFYSYRSELEFPKIPAYGGLDARIAWKAGKNLELAVVGKDLCDPHHPEFASYFLTHSVRELARSWYAKATLRF